MAEGINNIGTELFGFYKEFVGFFPSYIGVFFNFLIFVLIVVIYSVFVWKFYRFISKKNPLGLNLDKYQKAGHPFLSRLLIGGLYFLEYIIVLPFLIFIIFAIFTFFLIILTQSQDISQILIISGIVITAIRMTAYYKEELSREIAKMLPLTLLAIAVLNPNTFSQAQFIERIFTQLNQIPNFFSEIFYYLIFIIIIEALLRFFSFIFSLFDLEETEEIKEVKEAEEEIKEE